MKPQIALFTETKLAGNVGFKVEGYTFCGKSGKTKNCGGVGILVKDDLKHIITPHEPFHDIELFWVSIRQKNKKPIYCGIYYGKQESCSVQDMKNEMEKLCEEILEKKKDGEILFFTDGNAKIDILSEGFSRNGRLLSNVVSECELDIMNLSDKCAGKITRLNRGKRDEKSAIDFVFTSQEISHYVAEMLIDEDENYLLKGKAPTDHNSIIVKLNMSDIIKETNQPKVVKWRLSAPDELWNEFDKKLMNSKSECLQIMENPNNDLDTNYEMFTNKINQIACATIGKTTIRPNRGIRESKAIRELRAKKKVCQERI